MSLPIWKFDDIPFYPVNGDRVPPRWQRAPRVNVNNLLGTGLAEFNTFGYGEYRMQFDVFLNSLTNAELLEAAQGQSADLEDGTNTFTGVVLMSCTLRVRSSTHIEGSVEFARSGEI